ncbi:DUF4352 domain-containing protein [Listeria grandensis]|uniref:DUF4352 domain-containing protein n=1 Tax=Listeria grandensis TaxID=1494963 RepID=UPI00164D05FC|nr:DUF4352 domain-containing protein [Listeria grandensis]MBC6316192.1 DUF4352 domain-containing protein [Listeria grandensis]
MKKGIFYVISFCTIFTVVACSGVREEIDSDALKADQAKISEVEATKKPQTQDAKLTKTARKITMTVTQMKQTTTKKNTNIELKLELTNNASQEQGIGANDFRIEANDGSEYRIDGTKINFGDVVAPKHTLKGSAYFSLPSTISQVNLIYQPENKVEATWKLDIQ